jgi:arylsulfatase A-like enzyme/Tfp pilus assembly protein PilF
MGPLLVLALLAAPAASTDRPSVVIVTLDTTRADRMGFLGDKRGLTPGLDALARDAVVFERAYSQAPITTVSHASILSGTYPQFHKVNDFGVPLPTDVPYLPDLLRQRGYETAAFVGSLVLDPRAGTAPGFDRGFQTYDAGFRIRRGKEDRYQTMERRGEEVANRALEWLKRPRSAPFFLWVHLYDAHDPYDPPPAFARRFGARSYEGEVAYADAQVARLVAALRTRGLFDGTLVAVAADHGESLGDHGESKHGVFLYDATQHVPLVLKLPRGQGAGRRVPARCRLVDLVPTVLQSLGLEVPEAVQGESLLSLLGPGRVPDRDAYAETDYPRRAFGWSALAALRADRFLYVKAPRAELYDERTDPASKTNLAERRPEVAARVAANLATFLENTGGRSADNAKAGVDPALAERLAALGYVGGAAAPAGAGPGLDPKDRIAVSNTLHDAVASLESGEYDKAAPLLERVVESDPQIYFAQLHLGVARCRQRQFQQAIGPLHMAIELQPDSTVAHYEMGLARYETGEWKTAAGHFEIVVARLPKFAAARFSLGSVYARIDRVREAHEELQAALALEPNHYRANLLEGRLLDLQGKPAEAVPYLERAAAANADSAEAQAFLADAYEHLGRSAEAARARARAQSLRSPRS